MSGEDSSRTGVPRLLLVSTQPWPFPARLGMALRRAGFHVEGASPSYGYLGRSAAPLAWHRLRPWRLLRDLGDAIRRTRPDRLIPCDDVSTALMVTLHSDGAIRDTVERSLGDPASYPVALSKGAQMALAATIGVPIPPTAHLVDRAAFEAALQQGPLPRVLKVDGNFGGQGVAVLSDAASTGSRDRGRAGTGRRPARRDGAGGTAGRAAGDVRWRASASHDPRT